MVDIMYVCVPIVIKDSISKLSKRLYTILIYTYNSNIYYFEYFTFFIGFSMYGLSENVYKG